MTATTNQEGRWRGATDVASHDSTHAANHGADHDALGAKPGHAPREMRAIRGAITVDADEPALILGATAELLRDMMERNALGDDDLVSAVLTATPDLTSAFPAGAARMLGWDDVPVLCATEIAVTGALPRCVRAMLHVLTDRPRARIAHSYLRGAEVLRPDRACRPAAAATDAGARERAS